MEKSLNNWQTHVLKNRITLTGKVGFDDLEVIVNYLKKHLEKIDHIDIKALKTNSGFLAVMIEINKQKKIKWTTSTTFKKIITLTETQFLIQ